MADITVNQVAATYWGRGHAWVAGSRASQRKVKGQARRSRTSESKEQHGNWLESIISRRTPISPAEMGHRACSTCLIHDMAMVLKRKLYWDPVRERFTNDDEANGMLTRPQRAPYVLA